MTLPLFPELTAPKEKPPPQARHGHLSSVVVRPLPSRKTYSVLWLCLYFPDLVIESLTPGDERPCLVVAGEGGAARVVGLNTRARQAGVSTDMRLSSALALVKAPSLCRRDSARERACLAAAADAGMDFTGRVSVLPGEGLLLEVRGSLRLFGGLDVLKAQVLERMEGLGLTAMAAVAPTPLAAQWLARMGDEKPVTNPANLPGRLGRLPLAPLRLNDKTRRSMAGIGLRRLADLLRLPRDGIARRWGNDVLNGLDRALGRAPDPRICWRGQLRFHDHMLLPAETRNADHLMQAAQRMLEKLHRFLRRHDSQVEWLELGCHHHRRETSRLRLRLLGGSSDPKHLGRLLAIRMEALRLPEPVIELSLQSGPLRQAVAVSRGLFMEAGDSARKLDLLEQLRARLGDKRVFSLASRAVHHPEQGWCRSDPGGGGQAYPRDDRPLWLLAEPQPLKYTAGFQKVSGPERIETGWWQGRDIARDYYRVVSEDGRCLWIFHDRRGNHWFMHGLFG
ncbi:DNA polymerase Y family protein [Gammaproteobacteria bacterium AB-CW1]|uniref:DNA polymerase Y family protein n=1 Tax=Natronospira elongata TaxID=3110268 RepID=A0AAP6MKR7_9GAMM|nr:DNA polymerase Y family protein [Gammaproteobacteria bacterium AB-CW1]